MDLELDPDWASTFIQSRHALSAHERNDLLRRVDRNELVRVIPGIYLPSDIAAARTPRRAHCDLVYARELISRNPLIFSHASAAALWRLPRVGSWPGVSHVTGEIAAGGRSSRGITRHSIGTPTEEARIDGIRLTTMARTVVDLARTESYENAVIAADAALAGRRFGSTLIRTSRGQLRRELQEAEGRGVAAARAAITAADGRAGSPGETLSRVAMEREHLARPQLQAKFVDEFGVMYVDFFWPEFGVIGEFDGVGKYLREKWMDGRTAGQVVVDEKWREDRLRRLGPRVARWGWDLARQPIALARMLRSVGVR